MPCKVEIHPESGLPMIEQAGEFRVLGLLPPHKLCALPDWGASRPVLPAGQWQEIDLDGTYGLRVLDQRKQNSCVGHAVCSGMEEAWQSTGQPFQAFSPTFIYGLINGGKDQGAVISDALVAVKTYGICLENEVPHELIYRQQFPASAFATAKRFKLAEAFKCFSYEEICTALSLGRSVVVGVYVGRNFGDLDDEDTVPARPDVVIGGHAILLTGMKNTRKYGLIPRGHNSWSERWGRKGKFNLPKTYIDAMPYIDAFALEIVYDDPQDSSTDVPIARTGRLVMEQHPLVMKAMDMGLDLSFSEGLLKKLGEAGLELCLEAISNGLSKELLVMALDKIEPILMEWLKDMISGETQEGEILLKAPGGLVVAEDSRLLDRIIKREPEAVDKSSIFTSLLVKLLPVILEMLIKKM